MFYRCKWSFSYIQKQKEFCQNEVTNNKNLFLINETAKFAFYEFLDMIDWSGQVHPWINTKYITSRFRAKLRERTLLQKVQ